MRDRFRSGLSAEKETGSSQRSKSYPHNNIFQRNKDGARKPKNG